MPFLCPNNELGKKKELKRKYPISTHPACIVNKAEVGLVAEIWLHELGMRGMLSGQFVH